MPILFPHPLPIKPIIRPVRPRPFPIGPPVPAPPGLILDPMPDGQDYEILSGSIIYDGKTGKPLRNVDTGEIYE